MHNTDLSERSVLHSISGLGALAISDQFSDTGKSDALVPGDLHHTENRRVEILQGSLRDLVVKLVSSEFGVDVNKLQAKSRCVRKICIARQVCMYLLHTAFSVTYREIGGLLDRDRTTVSHGCAIIEDLRDDAQLDFKIHKIECVLETLQPLCALYAPGREKNV